MDTQQDWYQQRYGNGYAAAAKAKKREQYADLQAAQKQRKENNLTSAQSVFDEHQIPYEVRGTAWLCVLFGREYYFYPTTNKWRPKGGKQTYYSRGALDFLGKVVNYQRTYKSNQ